MIPVLILAAGQSRRMRGADKMLEDVAGQPLLAHQIAQALPIGPVFVALPLDAPERLQIVARTAAIPLLIADAQSGMGATLREAAAQMPMGPFMMVLGDLVALQTSDLWSVLNAMHKHPGHLIWRGATPDGKAGHPIVFAGVLRSEFEKLKGDTGGEAIAKPLVSKTYLHRFDDNRARYDLDTPEEWDAWRGLRK